MSELLTVDRLWLCHLGGGKETTKLAMQHPMSWTSILVFCLFSSLAFSICSLSSSVITQEFFHPYRKDTSWSAKRRTSINVKESICFPIAIRCENLSDGRKSHTECLITVEMKQLISNKWVQTTKMGKKKCEKNHQSAWLQWVSR